MFNSIFNRYAITAPRVSDPHSINLRPYNRDTDYQAVIDLIEGRYPEIGTSLDLEGTDIDLTDIDEHWRAPGGEFMVLTRGQQIIGSICARPIPESPQHAEFDWFFLRKDEEAKGLGLKLLKWGFEWCKHNQIELIELWSSEHRPITHKLYRKLGFEDNGVRKLFRDGPDKQYVLYFELDLTDEKKMERLEETARSIQL